MLTTLELFLTVIVNIIVGIFVGCSGIAGFLLPIFYVGYLSLPVTETLTISFIGFAITGIIGAFNYYKRDNLPMKVAVPIGLGSIFGAVVGVFLNSMIPPSTAKILLYIVVLVSGISILWRTIKNNKTTNKKVKNDDNLLESRIVVLLIGFITAIICALSGAGGPILVMPILVVLGLDIHSSIGVALFDSILIALPAIFGYASRSEFLDIVPLILISSVCLSIGAILGSSNAHRIKQKPLKITIGIFSIIIAIYMLLKI